jgi:ribosome-associated toxin RatA of RatAB toxin-antitoxin module
MATHRENRAIALSSEWLFDIVADVERYPEFLPLVREATDPQPLRRRRTKPSRAWFSVC